MSKNKTKNIEDPEENGLQNDPDANGTGSNDPNGKPSNGNVDGDDSGSSSNKGNDGGSNGEKTFSQAEVSRMMAKEKNQGRNAVFNELGINPDDKKMISLIKTLVNNQQDDGDDGSNDNGDESINAVTEAEQKAAIAEAKVEAMKMGVKPQFVDDAVTLAIAKMNDDEGADLKSTLGEFKSKYSIWFVEGDDDESHKGKHGTGSSVNPRGSGSKDGNENGLGKRLAARRKPGKKGGFSYWS